MEQQPPARGGVKGELHHQGGVQGEFAGSGKVGAGGDHREHSGAVAGIQLERGQHRTLRRRSQADPHPRVRARHAHPTPLGGPHFVEASQPEIPRLAAGEGQVVIQLQTERMPVRQAEVEVETGDPAALDHGKRLPFMREMK